MRGVAGKRVYGVFPTPVGMNRPDDVPVERVAGVPHTRGDEPARFSFMVMRFRCSPHPWG